MSSYIAFHKLDLLHFQEHSNISGNSLITGTWDVKSIESGTYIDQGKNIFAGRPESQVYYLFILIQCANFVL